MMHVPEENPLIAYEELLNIWSGQDYEPLSVDYWFYMRFNRALAAFLEQSPCVSWIFDLRSCQFDFISNNVLEVFGYPPSRFKEGGLDFCNEIKHPEDMPVTWGLLKQVWEFILGVPPADRAQYRFKHDYRVIKPGGVEVRILEQGAILQQDGKGNITHVLGICDDITSWKKKGRQMATVTNSIDHSVLCFTQEKDTVGKAQAELSRRELEIVRLLAQGLSSKCIADALSISFHTVNTHRQNMIAKTRVKNTGELVQFVICNGII